MSGEQTTPLAFVSPPPGFDPLAASAREDVCRYLAACYYQPDEAFAQEGLFARLAQAAARIDPGLGDSAQRLQEYFDSEDLQSLLVDYTRLFLGPANPRARPHGCFWLSGDPALMQPSTLDVLDLYRAGGFDIDGDFRELPDHVAVELEFLYLLTFMLNEAMCRGDADVLARNLALRRRFLCGHLGRWIAPFAAALRDGAQTPFYRELAELTERFVHMEAGSGTQH